MTDLRINDPGTGMIDLRSDTLSRPTPAMRQAMLLAEVGDDVYGEDPTVNHLEQQAAKLLNKQAALYVSSGTQSNLLALLTHCGRGDEYIVGQTAHTYRFEGGGAAALGGIQPQPLDIAADGSLDLAMVEAFIKPADFHFAQTKLLCLENTHNGIALSRSYVQDAARLCKSHCLKVHLDGARLFNAAVAQGVSVGELAQPFDSVSICLSKGLGAPVGSVLAGPEDFIRTARRWRKMLGGGMRQAGVIAAAGLYALEHNIERLAEDHSHAEVIAATLATRFDEASITQATNMIHLTLDKDLYNRFREHLQSAGIRVGRQRWVLHMDISAADIATICSSIESFR